MKNIYVCYVFTAIITFPYLPAMLLMGLNISYYSDQVILNGYINEPDADPKKVIDLSDVTLMQLIIYFVTYPFQLLLQLQEYLIDRCDGCMEIYRTLKFYFKNTSKKGSNIIYRFNKTFKRWWKNLR